MTVHNHGSEEGPGLSCNETVIDGKLKGACEVFIQAQKSGLVDIPEEED